MLPESTIDGVMEGLRECHRELTVHGTTVILDDWATANKPGDPPSARRSLSPSSSQPDVVALDLEAPGPWFPSPPHFFKPLLRGKEPWKKAPIDYVHIDPKQLFTKMNAGEGKGKGRGPPAVDLIVWHITDRVLELQADMDFTESAVMNAVAREIALSSAKNHLLEYLEDRLAYDDEGEDRGYTPRGADDPAVIEFVTRFKTNLSALVEEASSAPADFSVSHPRLPDDVEGRLREKAARNRRKRVDWEEYWRLSEEYKAAVQTHKSESAGEGASVAPAPAGDVPEEPQQPRYGADPIPPDPLAASPPPLVLRPMEDLYRVFTDAEIMKVFSKLILSRRGCTLCPGYQIWFEKNRAVKKDGFVRHEYGFKTGEPYC